MSVSVFFLCVSVCVCVLMFIHVLPSSLDNIITGFFLFRWRWGSMLKVPRTIMQNQPFPVRIMPAPKKCFILTAVFLHPNRIVFAAPRWSMWGNDCERGSKYRLNWLKINGYIVCTLDLVLYFPSNLGSHRPYLTLHGNMAWGKRGSISDCLERSGWTSPMSFSCKPVRLKRENGMHAPQFFEPNTTKSSFTLRHFPPKVAYTINFSTASPFPPKTIFTPQAFCISKAFYTTCLVLLHRNPFGSQKVLLQKMHQKQFCTTNTSGVTPCPLLCSCFWLRGRKEDANDLGLQPPKKVKKKQNWTRNCVFAFRHGTPPISQT